MYRHAGPRVRGDDPSTFWRSDTQFHGTDDSYGATGRCRTLRDEQTFDLARMSNPQSGCAVLNTTPFWPAHRVRFGPPRFRSESTRALAPPLLQDLRRRLPNG